MSLKTNLAYKAAVFYIRGRRFTGFTYKEIEEYVYNIAETTILAPGLRLQDWLDGLVSVGVLQYRDGYYKAKEVR